ncbi:hypothetical protein [Actinokineospora sp. NBRC 105648]|uniref:hypothetical protein n=1 Tax=Actinokineospora sp. NBRC 105648 TaxID=3032206 RepID=UPI0024A00F67|nr:hypothetical protein [Actinokineospora sp. NBRC 105648]GLZ42890.1 hypothetical protein Acsp05_65140 [Actinokineospora sp. NBRC 105648]
MVRLTGFGVTLTGPLMRCCFCGKNPELPDYLDMALRARDESPARQYLGAHPSCLRSVLAPGFDVAGDERSRGCCIHSSHPVLTDRIDIALRTREESAAAQYVGAHVGCLQSVLARGFTVEIHEM